MRVRGAEHDLKKTTPAIYHKSENMMLSGCLFVSVTVKLHQVKVPINWAMYYRILSVNPYSLGKTLNMRNDMYGHCTVYAVSIPLPLTQRIHQDPLVHLLLSESR